MPTPRPERSIAHVYAPRFPEDPVEIIGNRRGLERLVNSLIDAISVGKARGEVDNSDGTQSAVQIACLEGRRRSEEWRRSGSSRWDVADPFVARILELTEENRRLRDTIATLRLERKSIVNVDSHAGEAGPIAPG